MTAPDGGARPIAPPAVAPAGGLGRRRLLHGGVAGLVGVGGFALGRAAAPGAADDAALDGSRPVPQTVAFHGDHQAGIETAQQTHVSYLGLDLRAPDARGNLVRLLRLWTDDAARLTGGAGALGDQEEELAATPARLTATVAIGPSVFDEILPGIPGSCPRLPSFASDALRSRWGQTDVLLQLGGDDATSLAHARRVLSRTASSLTRPVWRQDGFISPRETRGPGSTPRNLLGQVDGTENPAAASEDFDRVVWIPDGPLRGGSHLVLRRIAMQLDTWEQVGRSRRERVLGRDLAQGAPLTGSSEHDPLDLDARGPDGSPTIPLDAHVRRAHAANPQERFLRRGYTYDDADGAGLLFAAYQADLTSQFLPVQQRLSELDALNEWTRAIGSATYTVLPGCRAGGTLGESLGLGA